MTIDDDIQKANGDDLLRILCQEVRDVRRTMLSDADERRAHRDKMDKLADQIKEKACDVIGSYKREDEDGDTEEDDEAEYDG